MQEIIVAIIVIIAVAIALRWTFKALNSKGNPCHGCSGCPHQHGKGKTDSINSCHKSHYDCKCNKKEEKEVANK